MRFVLGLGFAAFLAATAQAQSPSWPANVEILGSMPGSTGSTEGWTNKNADEVLFTFEQQDAPRLTTRIVAFDRTMPAGSILIQTGARKLYFVLGDGKAIEYPVGVGREGFTWSGTNRITRKAEWPTWRPPLDMIRREAEKGRYLPELIEGGEDNPLGARALYIGDTEYRIHGTNQPWTIGKAVSSGCIRMLNEQVIDLYGRVAMGALVTVE